MYEYAHINTSFTTHTQAARGGMSSKIDDDSTVDVVAMQAHIDSDNAKLTEYRLTKRHLQAQVCHTRICIHPTLMHTCVHAQIEGLTNEISGLSTAQHKAAMDIESMTKQEAQFVAQLNALNAATVTLDQSKLASLQSTLVQSEAVCAWMWKT